MGLTSVSYLFKNNGVDVGVEASHESCGADDGGEVEEYQELWGHHFLEVTGV